MLDRCSHCNDAEEGRTTTLVQVELVGFSAFPRDLRAGPDVDRLERARETREAHAIEIAEVRNEMEESL